MLKLQNKDGSTAKQSQYEVFSNYSKYKKTLKMSSLEKQNHEICKCG